LHQEYVIPDVINAIALFVKTVFSDEDYTDKFISVEGTYNARQLRTEFVDKQWTTSSINRLLKFRDTGTVNKATQIHHRTGSFRDSHIFPK